MHCILNGTSTGLLYRRLNSQEDVLLNEVQLSAFQETSPLEIQHQAMHTPVYPVNLIKPSPLVFLRTTRRRGYAPTLHLYQQVDIG
jgi:hypothetical protein